MSRSMIDVAYESKNAGGDTNEEFGWKVGPGDMQYAMSFSAKSRNGGRIGKKGSAPFKRAGCGQGVSHLIHFNGSKCLTSVGTFFYGDCKNVNTFFPVSFLDRLDVKVVEAGKASCCDILDIHK